MSKILLIIISGPPCTGKTTLGRKIAKELHLPLISRDDIKESLFDDLGWSDRKTSKKYGVASYTLLYYFIELLLKAGISFVVESNFEPKFSNKIFIRLRKKYKFKPFQIYCKTSNEILFKRFKNRSESSKRHPGHVDHLNYVELRKTLLKGTHKKLNIGGIVVDIDTTNFRTINYDDLFDSIKLSINT